MRMLRFMVIDNPVDYNKKLEESDESSLVDKGRYHRLVNRLIYLSRTCLGIAYAISVVASLYIHPRNLI